jgi:hypothetical protein
VVRAAAHLRPQPIALAMRNHSKLILVRSEQWCCRVSIDAAYPMRTTSGSIRAS